MIVDELGRIPMSPSLASSLARASGYAEAQLHREVTLEHLLLALTEDADAGNILAASHVDLSRVVTDVSGLLGRITDHNTPDEASRLAVSADLKRILEAAAAASRGRRREINGAIVLAAIVGDGRTPAAHILRTQGLTFEDAIRVLQRAMATPSTPQQQPSQPVDTPAPVGVTEDLLAGARARVSRSRADPPVARQPHGHVPEPSGHPIAAAPERITPEPSGFEAAGRMPDARATADDHPATHSHMPEAYAPAPHVPLPQVPEPPRPPSYELTAAAPSQAPQTTGFEPDDRGDERATAGLRDDGEIDDETAAAAAFGYQQPDLPSSGPVWAEANGTASAVPPPPPLPQAAQPQPVREFGPVEPHEHHEMAPSWTPPPLPRTPRPAGPPPLPADARGGRHEPARPVTPGASHPPPYPSFREPQVPPNPIYPPWPPVDMRASPADPHFEDAGPAPSTSHGPETSHRPPAGAWLPGVELRPPTLAPAGHRGTDATPAVAEPRVQGEAWSPTGSGAGPTLDAAAAPAAGQAGDAALRARPRVSGVAIGQLIENIPRAMRVAVPVLVEVRVAKADVKAVADGMSGVTARHEVMVTKAMSVRLRAPEGGFYIEPTSPETQWLENTLGLMADDYASWRWTVTPRAKGRRRLQLVVAARTVGRDGLAAETALPEQVIDVRVTTNYGLVARRWGSWIAAAIAGGVLQHFADPLIAAGARLANLLAAG